jgi:hypothetical protein
MTNADKELIAQLQTTLDAISKMRKHLNTRQEKCACKGDVFCSLHGTIYNRLQIVSDELARAIGDAQRE